MTCSNVQHYTFKHAAYVSAGRRASAFRNKFRCPKKVICDTSLQLSTRQVAAALYAYATPAGHIKKSFRELSRIIGRDTQTIQRAVAELASAGYLQIKRCHCWDDERQTVINDSNLYTLSMDFAAGYALAPYSIFRYCGLTPAAFVVSLYILQAAGSAHRAYPSISKIMSAVGISRSTVCRALRAIKELPLFLVQLCCKLDRKLSCNSYHVVRGSVQANLQLPANNDDNSAIELAAHPITEQRSILTRICSSVRTSIVRLVKNIGNALPSGLVVPNFLHKGRNKITRVLTLQVKKLKLYSKYNLR